MTRREGGDVEDFHEDKGEHEMKPSDIMKMDWLVDNVVGSIPPMSEFIDNAKMVVELKGVEGNKL